ncbi:Mitochondrial biogenesis AIM24 [Gracilaria domingensis]|nr:Mitochondrial biogenesis AIM24 [Gracilaria domingensis]
MKAYKSPFCPSANVYVRSKNDAHHGDSPGQAGLKRLASNTLATVSSAALKSGKMNADSRCPSVITKLVAKAASSSSKATPIIVKPVHEPESVPMSTAANVSDSSDSECEREYIASNENICIAHVSFSDLVNSSWCESKDNQLFEVQNQKLLRINLPQSKSSTAWIKYGTRVASLGTVKFRAQGMRDQGLTNVLKKTLTAEGMKFVKCEGNGVVFCADEQKLLHVLELGPDEILFVNGSNLLAICADITYDIKFMTGMNVASGIFCVKLTGNGIVAFGCHGAVVALEASEASPVYTDPSATVAWTHAPTVKVRIFRNSSSSSRR